MKPIALLGFVGSVSINGFKITMPKPKMIKVGDKIKFKKEKQRYTVRACNNRFAICTKPFNPRKTMLYTVIDFEEKIRGTENLIFGMGAETDKQCNEMFKRLESGETEVSYRNRVLLDIEKVVPIEIKILCPKK